jgi:eukaryotic-like serine/threonine-protein kinase
MERKGTIKYKTKRQIGVGQGLNSEVFLIDEMQLGGVMAAKEVDKAAFRDPSEYFAEAQRMWTSSHPNVVEVQYTCDAEHGKIALIMPYYKKGSLADRIKNRPLELNEVIRVSQGILAGVAQIHQNNLIHFDIKPSNVLFSDMDVPLVADFGQTRSIDPATGHVVIPAMYIPTLPPEAINTIVATKAADIYHVGVLLYRCLNGEAFYKLQTPPNATIAEKIVKGKFPDRKKFLPHVPKGLRRVVRKALKVDPAERYQTAADMMDALSRIEIKLNWATEPLASKGMRWRAKRERQPDLVVELLEQGSTWTVKTFTEVPGEQPRAKDRTGCWKKGLSTRDAAFAHLDEVFERLQQ